MPYTQLSLLQLRTRLKDRVERVAFWSDAQANDAINEALLTYGMLTGRWKRRVVLATTANQYELALPSTMVYRMGLTWNGQPMTPTTLEDLNLARPNWRQEKVTDGGSVPTRPTLWAPVSLMLVYIWPQDVSNHNGYGVDGVSATPTLSADGDYVDLSDADISVLLGFALHVLTYKKGAEDFEASLGYFRDFIVAAAEENSLITTSQWYRQFMGRDDRSFKRLTGQPSPVATLVPNNG